MVEKIHLSIAQCIQVVIIFNLLAGKMNKYTSTNI